MPHSELTVRPSRNLVDQDRIYAVVASRGRGADAQERAAHAQLGQMFSLTRTPLPVAPRHPDRYGAECASLRALSQKQPHGDVQSGPRFAGATGSDIIASGPALCSPLKGVGLEASNPHGTASWGLLNQNPRWNVLVGGRRTGFGVVFVVAT